MVGRGLRRSSAQQSRMRVIAENLAQREAGLGQTKGGDPYRRQVPIFAATQLGNGVDKGGGDDEQGHCSDKSDSKANTSPAVRRPTTRAM